MKRVLLFELAAVLGLALLLAGLSSETQRKDLDPDDFISLLAQAEGREKLEKQGALRLRRDFSLEEEDYDWVCFEENIDTMSVDLILAVHLTSEDQSETVQAAMESYLESRKAAFEGYGPEQTALLEKARLWQEDRYAVLLIGPYADQWLSLIQAGTEES